MQDDDSMSASAMSLSDNGIQQNILGSESVNYESHTQSHRDNLQPATTSIAHGVSVQNISRMPSASTPLSRRQSVSLSPHMSPASAHLGSPTQDHINSPLAAQQGNTAVPVPITKLDIESRLLGSSLRSLAQLAAFSKIENGETDVSVSSKVHAGGDKTEESDLESESYLGTERMDIED